MRDVWKAMPAVAGCKADHFLLGRRGVDIAEIGEPPRTLGRIDERVLGWRATATCTRSHLGPDLEPSADKDPPTLPNLRERGDRVHIRGFPRWAAGFQTGYVLLAIKVTTAFCRPGSTIETNQAVCVGPEHCRRLELGRGEGVIREHTRRCAEG